MRILVTILIAMLMSGCTGMLLGGNVSAPPPSEEEEESKK